MQALIHEERQKPTQSGQQRSPKWGAILQSACVKSDRNKKDGDHVNCIVNQNGTRTQRESEGRDG